MAVVLHVHLSVVVHTYRYHPKDKSYTRGFRLVRADIAVALAKTQPRSVAPLDYTRMAARITFTTDENLNVIQVVTVQGSLLKAVHNSRSVDLAALGLSHGVYLFRIRTESRQYGEIISIP